jgi:hypothetical protein
MDLRFDTFYCDIRASHEEYSVSVSVSVSINAGLIYSLWDKGSSATKIRLSTGFPEFANRIGLVDAWNRYGWPSACQPLPNTDDDNAQFACQ